MTSWYVIQKRGTHHNSIDYTKRYNHTEALRIVQSGYGKGPSGYDLYTMVKMYA